MKNTENEIINLIEENYLERDIPGLLARVLVLTGNIDSDSLFFFNYFRELDYNNDYLSTKEMTNLSYIINGFIKHKFEGHDVELSYNLNISV